MNKDADDLLKIIRDFKELVKRAKFDYEYPGYVYPIGPDGIVDYEPKLEEVETESLKKPKKCGIIKPKKCGISGSTG